MDPRDLIKRPLITERTTDLMEQNKYVFEVDRRANKTEIRQAVEKLFDVKVEQVNTVRTPGKRKRVGKHVGYTQEKKKAIVKLAADSKPIEIFGEA
jgi:large subunit ribosomal protein L23